MTAIVTAIIPTLAERVRRANLARAINSLRESVSDSGILAIHVIVNGQQYDEETVAWLRSQPVSVLQIEESSSPIAQCAGRQLVETEYFCFLDDDDEYLPGSIDARLAVMLRRPDLSLVVTNGWRKTESLEEIVFAHMAQVEQDPLLALVRENWLASCGALFRTDCIGRHYFEDYHQYLEWTWLGFRIAADGHRVGVLDVPTFRIHDTSESVSKSDAYEAAHLPLFDRMLAMTDRKDVRAHILRRAQGHWNARSVRALWGGNLREAWMAYWNVARYPRAWRYSGQLLRLLWASVKRAPFRLRDAA